MSYTTHIYGRTNIVNDLRNKTLSITEVLCVLLLYLLGFAATDSVGVNYSLTCKNNLTTYDKYVRMNHNHCYMV